MVCSKKKIIKILLVEIRNELCKIKSLLHEEGYVPQIKQLDEIEDKLNSIEQEIREVYY